MPGRDVPESIVSIQLWTFAEYISVGTDAATVARLEEVLRRLSEMEYRNVEAFTLSGLGASSIGRCSTRTGSRRPAAT